MPVHPELAEKQRCAPPNQSLTPRDSKAMQLRQSWLISNNAGRHSKSAHSGTGSRKVLSLAWCMLERSSLQVM